MLSLSSLKTLTTMMIVVRVGDGAEDAVVVVMMTMTTTKQLDVQ